MTVSRSTLHLVARGVIGIAVVLAAGLVAAVVSGSPGADVLGTALGGALSTLAALFVTPDRGG